MSVHGKSRHGIAGHAIPRTARTTVVYTLLLCCLATPSAAQDAVNQNVVMELLGRLQSLEREVRSLRGEVEEQTHTFSRLRDQQKQQYLDLEGRLRALEQPGGAVGVAPRSGGADNFRDLTITGELPAPSADTSPPRESAQRPAATIQATPATSAALAGEQAAYQDAFELLKAGRYAQASELLSQFLAQYPDGQFAANAQYWLAESYYVSNELEPALQQFDKFTREYPSNGKMSQALLKIGYIYDRMGLGDDARRVLTELIDRFPDTAAARLGRKRLDRLGGQ